MKKLLYLALALVLVLALCACGEGETTGTKAENIASMENATTGPVEDETTAPIENETTTPVGNATTTPIPTEPPTHIHSYGDWTIIAEAGCTEDGQKERSCSCGEKQSEAIPATGHNFVNGKCSECGLDLVFSEGLHYTLNEDGNGYTVAGIGVCMDALIAIPSTYEGKPVTAIASSAFADWTMITDVVIPNGVTQIGESAFSGCTNIQTVAFPDTLTSIGKQAFCNCQNLRTIVLPDSLTSIGKHAFVGTAFYDNDDNWTEDVLYISNHLISVKSNVVGAFAVKVGTKCIADNAFSNCGTLLSVQIPNGVVHIGSNAFEQCSRLNSVSIPSSVTSIGEDAFEGCSSLASITIPDSVTSIESGTFSGCSSLANVSFGSGVTSIGSYAFSDCSGLTSITIPYGVKSISGRAFSGCSGLKNIVIANSVEYIGKYAFLKCNQVESLTVPFADKSWDGSGNTGLGYIFGKYEYYFYYSYIPSSLKTLVIGGGTSIIDNWCSTVGHDWEDKELYGNITSITILDSVTSIGDKAFSGCSGLTSITIPDSVTSIGSSAFDGCSGLTAVYISDLAMWCNIDFGSNPLSYAKNLYVNGELATDVVIPNGVTSIGNKAFYSCESLISITIPDSVTSIGSSAFDGCSGLTSITIGNGASIGMYAFSNCSSLTSITIPDGVTSIGYKAFSNCSSLKSVDIAESVESVGEYIFFECESMESITIPYITDKAWGNYSCRLGYLFGTSSYNGRTNPHVPDSLKSVVIRGGEYIGDYAFWDCSSLTSITIPESVTSIGYNAFYNCSELETITFNGTIEQWHDISKGYDWNSGIDDYTIICSNGEYNMYYLVATPVSVKLSPDNNFYQVIDVITTYSSIYYWNENTSIVSCEWSKVWSNGKTQLYISGESYGTTTVYIYDSDDGSTENTTDVICITVTVEE